MSLAARPAAAAGVILLAGAALIPGCTTPDHGVPSGVTAVSAEDGTIWDDDLLKRLSESLARASAFMFDSAAREDNVARLMLNLERLLPS